MKRLGLFILFSGAICVNAQSFKLYQVVNFTEGEEIANETILIDTCKAKEVDYILYAYGEMYAILENTSSESKTVVCERKIIEMFPGAETVFCWDGCNEADVSIDEKMVEANTKTGVLDFISKYTAPIGLVGSSIVRYVFYEKDNADDSISLILEYVTLPNLSVSMYSNNILLSIYPNPTQGQLRITNYELGMGDYTIYNIIGQSIIQGKMQESAIINVESLANGMYFLKIDNKVMKFVKE